jgi:signal transduction histidine kinase/ActR/RegA family two-component response regulator
MILDPDRPDPGSEEDQLARILLDAELCATRRLHETGSQLVSEGHTGAIYENILDTAMAVMHSDFASLQMLDLEKRALLLLAHRGFTPDAARFWALVPLGNRGASQAALEHGGRIVVPDVEREELIASGDELEMFRRHNIRSYQSTPLSSRTGQVVGMLSTHWSLLQVPSERDLSLLDLFARQAADLIELNQSKQVLREADRRKDEFLAMLSHEIRNPLAPISNAVRVLEMGPIGDELRGEAFGVLDRQLAVMTRLVDDLLDVSRVSSGRIQLQFIDVDLNGLVQRAANSCRPLMLERDLEFVVSPPGPPGWMRGDMVRLEQVVFNLLSNAAKYTPKGGQVWLSYEEEGDEALIRVRDSGIGIDPELLVHIFELFTQAKREPDRPQSGLGIGLNLAKRLVELHGGSITAHSEGAGRGSEFLVRLPTIPVASVEPDPPAEGTERSVGGRLRVLLVEDVEDSRRIFGRLLELLGHEVRVAQDALTALEAALDFRPHVVLLDIALPGIDGYELAGRIRQEPVLENVVLVAVTGYGQAQDRRRSQEAGFAHHLLKPPDIDLLEQLLADISRTATD